MIDHEKTLDDLKLLNALCHGTVLDDALALLKEQKETINDLTDTIRQLNQHIKDLSEYMTPYGKLKDVKACVELLKEQESTINELQNAYGYLQKQFFEAQDKLLKEHEAVVRCKDCTWWGSERFCENSDSPCFQNGCTHGNWYCADGERK